MSTIESRTFNHPLLGPLTGLASASIPHTIQFRSIPFALIPDRFRQSTLLTKLPAIHTRNFTNYGTACPSPPQTDQIEASGGLLPGEEEKKFDELTCLNLTISAPRGALNDERRALPVMVYVHGGAFTVGSTHISALHDTTRLVELSIKEGHPVIIVSIHYRLHWLGFIACQDLLNEATSLNEPPANFGLHDQRNAFLWIKRFIPSFGGDPNRITAFGESAGSGSIVFHMCSDVPLFNRAILMSGLPASVPPLELNFKEAEYRALLKYCGIDEEDPRRLQKLREMPVQKLIDAIQGTGVFFHHSYQDEKFWPRGSPTYFTEDELIGGCEWVGEIVIGDAFFEGWLLSDGLKHINLDQFLDSTYVNIGSSNATKLLSAYGIEQGMDVNLFWNKLSYLMGDIMFSEPIHKLAVSLASSEKQKVYRYSQTIRNPFPGTLLHQIPGHHFIDLLFLFQNLRDRYPSQKLKDISEEYGRRWIRFAVGEEPWEEYKIDQEKVMVINGRTGFEIRTRRKDELESALSEEGVRRYAGWEVIGEIMEDLVKRDGLGRATDVKWKWGTDDGIFRLAGLDGPYEDAIA